MLFIRNWGQYLKIAVLLVGQTWGSFRQAWQRASWVAKCAIVAYSIIYTALMAIYIVLCALALPIFLSPALRELRGTTPISSFSDDAYLPPEGENLELAQEILSYCSKAELDDIVASALAEKPRPQLERVVAIIKGV